MTYVAEGATEVSCQPGVDIAFRVSTGSGVINCRTKIDDTGFWIVNADTGAVIGGLYGQDGQAYLGASALVDPRVASDLYVALKAAVDSGLNSFNIVFVKGTDSRSRIGVVQDSINPDEYDMQMYSDGDIKIKSDAWVRIESVFGGDGRIYLQAGKWVVVDSGAIIPMSNASANCGMSGQGFNYYYGAHTSIQSTSDEREKHDMRPLDADQMVRFLLALNPVWYRLNDVPDDLMAGFGANQFREAMRGSALPEDYAGFNGKNPDHLCLDYGQLIAPLVATVQAQKRRIEALEKRLPDKALEV